MQQTSKNQQNIKNQTYFKVAVKTEKESKSIAAAKDPELLFQHIQSINAEAEFFFKRKDYQSALKKLKQAELILQYVAESCRKIKKDLIIVILNNLVCVSQMLWDLKSASDYLQGIIYNLSMVALTKNQYKLNQSNIMSSILQHQQDLLSFSEHLKLARYQLQYCAINSSLQRYNNALIAARKSLKTCMLYINTLAKQSSNKKAKEGMQDELFYEKLAALKACVNLRQVFGKEGKRQDFLNLVYSFWRKEVATAQKGQLQDYFKAIYLGDIMSLSFVALQNENIPDKFQETPYYLFLLASISYFSVAIELKNITQIQHQKDPNYFFFMAIITYMLLVPYQSPYLQYLLNNYQNTGKPPLIYLQKTAYAQINDFIKTQEGILPQQSVATPEIHRRKNLRLDEQNQKLKKIIQNNDFTHKKELLGIRSFDKKIKSLSTSRNKSKKHIQNGRQIQTLKSNNVSRKYQEQFYCQQQKYPKECKSKKHQYVNKYDELGQKYFEMAFKKASSPQVVVRKQSGNSESSTKDQSCSEKVVKLSKSKKEKVLGRRLKNKK